MAATTLLWGSSQGRCSISSRKGEEEKDDTTLSEPPNEVDYLARMPYFRKYPILLSKSHKKIEVHGRPIVSLVGKPTVAKT